MYAGSALPRAVGRGVYFTTPRGLLAGGVVVVSGARGISVGCAWVVVSFTGCDVIVITITAAHADGSASHGCLATLKCHYREDLCSLMSSVGVWAYSLRYLCIDPISLSLSISRATFIAVWGFISGYWVF